MKLSAPSHCQQILFALALVALIPFGSHAQQATIQRNGQPLAGNILGVQDGKVQFQTKEGTVSFPLPSIESVQMPAPPEVAAAEAEFVKKDYEKSLQLAKKVSDQFAGLPVEWAQRMAGLVGDLHVLTNDLAKAEAAYDQFDKSYPGLGGLQANVGRARIAAAKGDFEEAKAKLDPIIEQALKDKNVPFANRIPYSGAFYVMGLVKESEKDFSGALEDYLRTVTIFYHDPTALAAAQDRAEALRTEKKVHVP